MKGAYFFITFFGTMICFTGRAQVVSNTDVHGKKTINSVIPPQLSYPTNNSTVVVPNPVFIWIPPRPSNGGMVTYSIRLVKVEKGQTPVEALLQNPPLLSLNGLTNTFISYPADAQSLEINAQYAWQVAASSQGQSLGVADVSVFNMEKDKRIKDNYINYPVVAKANKEHYYVSHGIFYFAYDNMDNEGSLSYTIKNSSTNSTLKGLPAIKLRPGMNKLNVDLKQTGTLKNDNYYYLEIKNKQQQVYKLVYYYIES